MAHLTGAFGKPKIRPPKRGPPNMNDLTGSFGKLSVKTSHPPVTFSHMTEASHGRHAPTMNHIGVWGARPVSHTTLTRYPPGTTFHGMPKSAAWSTGNNKDASALNRNSREAPKYNMFGKRIYHYPGGGSRSRSHSRSRSRSHSRSRRSTRRRRSNSRM